MDFDGGLDQRDASLRQSEIDALLWSIQQDIIDQENSTFFSNVSSNRDVASRPSWPSQRPSDKSSELTEIAAGIQSSQTTEKATERAGEKPTERPAERVIECEFQRPPESDLESSQQRSMSPRSMPPTVYASNQNNQPEVSALTSNKRPAREFFANEQITSHLEQIQEEYRSVSKRIQPQRPCDQFNPFDRVRPTYLLKEALNSHSLNEIARLYTLITKQKSTCPYLLSKTGFLLFRKYIELKPVMEERLCSDLVDFVNYVRFCPGRHL